MHRLRGLFGLHLLPQGFAVVRWTVEKTWLRWSQKYRIRAVCRELMRTASPVDVVFMRSVGSVLVVKKEDRNPWSWSLEFQPSALTQNCGHYFAEILTTSRQRRRDKYKYNRSEPRETHRSA